MAATPRDKALRDGGLAALCKWVRALLDAIVEQTNTALGEADEAISGKLDIPTRVAFTIPVSGWKTDSTVPGFTKYIDISVPGLLGTECVGVDVDPVSTSVARAANFTSTESFAGVLRLRAAAVPTAAIKAEYHIVGTQAAATKTAAVEKEV